MLSLQFVTHDHLEIQCLKPNPGVSNGGILDGNNQQKSSLDNLDDIIDLSFPIQQLRSIDDQFAPRQMLRCILLAHRGINVALNAAVEAGFTPDLEPSSVKHHHPPGADDVLPTLILAVLRAHPPKLISNLRFVEYFAPASLLRGEAGYAYTNLYGAVQFLKKLDIEGHMAEVTLGGLGEGAMLSIGPEEFRAGLERCRQAMKDKSSEDETEGGIEADGRHGDRPKEARKDVENFSDDEESLTPRISARDVREAREHGETVDIDWALRKQAELLSRCGGVQNDSELKALGEEEDSWSQHLPPEEPPLPSYFSRSYSFLATQPDDIRMSDLPRLLKEYQMLVHATELLLNERTVWRESERKRQMKLARKNLEKSYGDVMSAEDTESTNKSK